MQFERFYSLNDSVVGSFSHLHHLGFQPALPNLGIPLWWQWCECAAICPSTTVQSRNLPFQVRLACDPSESGRSLFQEFTSCRLIFNSATDLLNHIRASGDTSVIHGYLIHSPRFQTSDTTTTFWQIQATIISQLRLIRSLSIIIAMIHPDNNSPRWATKYGRLEHELVQITKWHKSPTTMTNRKGNATLG